MFFGTIHARDAPNEEPPPRRRMRRTTMMKSDVLRQEEDRSVEREREIHVCLVIIIMVRMLICYFGNIIRILSHNKIPVLYSAEDFCSTGD